MSDQNNELVPETEHEWETELRYVLSGKRDYALLELGSITGYIDRLLSAARSEETSLANFFQAVERIVSTWHPEKATSEYFTFGILELIGAYQPAVGFLKIISFIQRGFRFPLIPFERGGYGSGQDLHMKALVVLEYYYPASPPKNPNDAAYLT